MDKQKLYVCSFSGGKDSTAMLLRLLEEEMPVDIILFCDTGLEFPQLYRHLDKVEQAIGREITRVKAEHDFEYYFARIKVKRKENTANALKYGMYRDGYGWAGPRMRWCTERLKGQPRKQYLRNLRDRYDVIEYVGLAADEMHRLEHKCNQDTNCRHPLIDWGMTEADCLQFCRERGFDWDGLYDLMDRVSCWCCPLQSLKSLRVLYRNFPEQWAQLKRWDSMTWRPFRADYSVAQLETRFDFEEEWQKAGKPLRNKAFYDALKRKLEGADRAGCPSAAPSAPRRCNFSVYLFKFLYPALDELLDLLIFCSPLILGNDSNLIQQDLRDSEGISR